MLVMAVFVLIVGLLMFIKPKTFWQITEQWKSYSAEEPSDFYIKSTKFGGAILALVGVAGLIAFSLK